MMIIVTALHGRYSFILTFFIINAIMIVEHIFYLNVGGDLRVYVSENRTQGNGGGSHKDKKNVLCSGNVDKTWKEPIHVR